MPTKWRADTPDMCLPLFREVNTGSITRIQTVLLCARWTRLSVTGTSLVVRLERYTIGTGTRHAQ